MQYAAGACEAKAPAPENGDKLDFQVREVKRVISLALIHKVPGKLPLQGTVGTTPPNFTDKEMQTQKAQGAAGPHAAGSSSF